MMSNETATDNNKVHVCRRGDRYFSLTPVMVIGVKSAVGLIAAIGYIGLWCEADSKVEWRPIPLAETENERLLNSVLREAKVAIPVGSDITPPCKTQGDWYFLYPQPETER